MNVKVFSILLGVLLVISSKEAYADKRSYVWTYEYMTMPKGMAEFEYYVTAEVPDNHKSNVSTWKHWLELEYGLTERLDISMYQQFKQSNKITGSAFEYDGFKLRTRYRIGEKDKFLLDPLLYAEYIRNDNLSTVNVFEGKVILAKDIEKFNIAYNQIIKQELESGGETEHEFAGAAGYAITDRVKLGLETKGNYTTEKYYIGPTVSFSAKNIWVASGVVLGLNDKSDDVQARMIVGVLF